MFNYKSEHIFFFQTFIFGIRIYSAVSGSRSSEKYFVDFFLYMYNMEFLLTVKRVI